jgi:16S rRNA (uracil1498-N3)-methyltransferase
VTPRLYLPQLPNPADAELELTVDRAQSHYLTRVLRLRPGDRVQVFDGCGRRFEAQLVTDQRDACKLCLTSAEAHSPAPRVSICLAQCLATGDKMDWIIEKAVELGVSRIVTLKAERCQLRLDTERAARRLEHWQRIVEAACMQSGQDHLPQLDGPMALTDWLSDLKADPARASQQWRLLDPEAPHLLSESGLSPDGSVTLLVGPESGLSDAEIQAAVTIGFQRARMGAQVLRTETAGLAAIAAIQTLAGVY